MRQLSYVIAVVVAGLGFALMTAAGCFPFSYETNVGGGGSGTTTTATSSSTGGMPCTSDLACDDGNVCTAEECTKGSCVYVSLDQDPGPGSKGCTAFKCDNGVSVPTTKDGDPCGMGLTCVGTVCTGCTLDTDCGKTDECQTSTCQPDMKCKYDYTPSGTKVVNPMPADVAGDCMATTCDGVGSFELTPDAMDAPADEVCADGQCVNGKPVQTPLALGTPCAGNSTFCGTSQSCVTCTINAGCAMGTTCYQENGCVSCGDGFKNGDETGIDCGGSCSPCADTLACDLPKDCKSMRCEDGICVSCSDGVKNSDEVEKDCGGAFCLACPGTSCMSANTCALGFCVDTVCCDSACAGACRSCNLPGKGGICSVLALGVDDPLCDSSVPVCDKVGSCVVDGGKGHYGDPCSQNNDCFSMNCQGTAPSKTCK